MLSITETMYMLNRVNSAVTFRALKIVDSYMFQCLELKDTIIILSFTSMRSDLKVIWVVQITSLTSKDMIWWMSFLVEMFDSLF